MKIRRSILGIIFSLVIIFLADTRAIAFEMQFEGGITAVYQHADNDLLDDELSASADLFITLPLSSGEWLLYLEGITAPDNNGVSSLYPTANADAGSVIADSHIGGVQVSEFNYTFRLSTSRTFMLGIMDPTAWMDRSRMTNDENIHFLNGSFVNNPTIEFPDYTLGGVFRDTGNTDRPELVLVVASSHGIADFPDRSYTHLLNLNSDNKGVFLGGGASWHRDDGSTRFGLWLRTDQHEVGSRPDSSEMNYGAYLVWGTQVQGHFFNVRLGISNGDVSVSNVFIGLAYERETALGLFGVGIARTFQSKSFEHLDLSDTTDAEVFFRIPILEDTLSLTPSVQYVQNPGINFSGSQIKSDMIVAGLRLRWNF